MSLENYEELNSAILNITQLGWSGGILTADFGGGYGAGATIAPYGLHRWSLSADLIPDLDDYPVDYEFDGDEYSDPRFTYLFEFIKRHILRGNKPFILNDHRTGKKFLVSLTEISYDFDQITAKILAGGISVVERRVSGIDFNEDGSIDLDDMRPTGSLAVSQNGGLYKDIVTITATVSDNVAVERVEFYIDYELLLIDYSAAYAASWDTTRHKNGPRKIRAKVYDAAGNFITLSTVVNVLNERVKPTVSITSPAAGEFVTGTITITATASDNVAIDRVEFYYFDGAGFAFIASDPSNPYSAILDTSLLPVGELVLSATAFDTSGNASDAAFVTVNIKDDPYPPGETIIYSVTGTSTSQALIKLIIPFDEEAYGAESEDDYLI